jgi:ABC-type uncharacterized transport system auxiliary subunit
VRRAAGIAAILSLLGSGYGCVKFPVTSTNAVRLFTLSPAEHEAADEARLAGTLRVEEPAVASPYRGTMIAVRDGNLPNEIRYSREGRFAVPVASLLGERLAEMARNGGWFGSVRFPGQGGPADWTLRSRVETFEAHLAEAGLQARVAASFELLRSRDTQCVLFRRYEEAEPVSETNAGAVVAGLTRAFDRTAARFFAEVEAAVEARP